MQNIIFITGLASVLSIIFFWSFRHLPNERWQILGAIPIYKQANGQWQGLNLTYYGLINACAVTFALAMTFILLGAVGLPMKTIIFSVCGVLMVFAPFAKWMAQLVEKKNNTFTIGGASFCGLVGSPLLILAVQPIISHWGSIQLPLMPFMASLAIGYAFGEGIGRLSCLSFGCCYGKPIERIPRLFQPIATHFCVVFHGETKKAAYAGRLNGQKVLAIQSITAVLYSISALTGVYLFLQGHHKSAYLICILVTQIWRILSEFLRADYRGNGTISAYQYLAGIAAVAAVIYVFVLPGISLTADLGLGLGLLWDPVIILICQFVWISIFLFTGRSKTTAARVSLFVRSTRI